MSVGFLDTTVVLSFISSLRRRIGRRRIKQAFIRFRILLSEEEEGDLSNPVLFYSGIIIKLITFGVGENAIGTHLAIPFALIVLSKAAQFIISRLVCVWEVEAKPKSERRSQRTL